MTRRPPPEGFRAAGVAAGLKAHRRRPTSPSSSTTARRDAPPASSPRNRVKAAPVLWSQQVLRAGIVRAVVLNSGGANACTGPDGLPGHPRHRRAHRGRADRRLGWSSAPVDVAVCSTGLIGERLPMDKLLRRRRRRRPRRSRRDGGAGGGRGDHDHRHPCRRPPWSTGDGWTVGGMAKGAGMLAPGLATMLCVLTTDAVADSAVLRRRAAGGDRGHVRPGRLRRLHVHQRHRAAAGQRRVRDVADRGRADRRGHRGLPRPGPAAARRRRGRPPRTSRSRCGRRPARPTRSRSARSVARNNLVKTALFGADPNWGRILAAVGTTRRRVRPGRARRRDQRRLGLPGRRRRARTASKVDLSGRDVHRRGRPARRRRRRRPSGPTTCRCLRARELGVLDMSRRHARPRPRDRAGQGGHARSRRCRGWSGSTAPIVVVKYGGNAMTDAGAAARLRRRHGLPAATSGSGRSSCTAAARRSPPCSTGSASPASSAAACGSPRRRRWTWSGWCWSARSAGELVGLINEHGPFAVGLSGEDARLFTAVRRTGASWTARRSTSAWSATSSRSNPDAVTDLIDGRPDPGRLDRRPGRRRACCTTSTPTPRPPRSPSRCGRRKLVVLTDVDGLYARLAGPRVAGHRRSPPTSWPSCCPAWSRDGARRWRPACARSRRGAGGARRRRPGAALGAAGDLHRRGVRHDGGATDDGMQHDALAAARGTRSMMDNYGTPPLALVRGEGAVVWDADGKSLRRPARRHRGQRARPRPPGRGRRR